MEGQEITIILPDRDLRGFIQAINETSISILFEGLGIRHFKKGQAMSENAKTIIRRIHAEELSKEDVAEIMRALADKLGSPGAQTQGLGTGDRDPH